MKSIKTTFQCFKFFIVCIVFSYIKLELIAMNKVKTSLISQYIFSKIPQMFREEFQIFKSTFLELILDNSF